MKDDRPVVLHTVHALGADGGGPSRTVPALCEAVARNADVRVVLLTTRRTGACNLLPDPVLVESVELATDARPGGESLRRRFAAAVADVHRRSPVAILHDHGQWLGTNRAAAAAARSLGLRRVVTPRGMLSPWALSHRRLVKRAAWSAFAKRDLNAADAIHATSDLEARELAGLGVRPRVVTIPNGVNLPADPPGRGPAGNGPSGAGAEEREVLFLSRVHPKKGLPDLLDAWGRLTARGLTDGWRLRIVGPDEGGHRRELEDLAAAGGVADRVHFQGAVPDAEKWPLYRAADLFVLPTHSENFGVVVAEALACETPVLTTTAAPWQVLRDRGCGWWVEPGAASVGAALEDALAKTPAQLAAMGARGRPLVADRFSWDAAGRETADFYEDLLSAPAAVPRPWWRVAR